MEGEAAYQFRSGIELSFSRWIALQIAIEEAGRSPAFQRILVDKVYSLFTRERTYVEDVEELLDEEIKGKLGGNFDDGSIEEVALNLMFMHEECLEGNYSSIEKLRETIYQRPNVVQGEAAYQFKSGIELSFSRWIALQIAIEEDRRSPAFQRILVDKVYSLFTRKRTYLEDVEELLDEEIKGKLGGDFDDGSIEEVALNLMFMHEKCLEGNYSSIEKLRATGYQRPNDVQVVDSSGYGSGDDIIDDDSDMEVDVVTPSCRSTSCSNRKETTIVSNSSSSIVNPHLEVEVEDEGWIVVDNKKKKRGGKKRGVPTLQGCGAFYLLSLLLSET